MAATINVSLYKYYTYNKTKTTWSASGTEGIQGYTAFSGYDEFIRSHAVKLEIVGNAGDTVTGFKTRVKFEHEDGYTNAPAIITNTQAFLFDASFANGETYKNYTNTFGDNLKNSVSPNCVCTAELDSKGGLYYAVAEFSNVNLNAGSTYYLLYLPKTQTHGRCNFNFTSTTEKVTVLSTSSSGSGGGTSGGETGTTTLTGITIKVDNRTYNGGSGVVEIPSTTELITIIVSGTNFAALSDGYQICYGTDSVVESLTASGWNISTTANTATRTFTLAAAKEAFGQGFTGEATNIGVWLTENWWVESSRIPTGITMQLASTQSSEAIINNILIRVSDGVNEVDYGNNMSAGNIAIITPDTRALYCLVAGDNFENLNENNVICPYPGFNHIVTAEYGWTINVEQKYAFIEYTDYLQNYIEYPSSIEYLISNTGVPSNENDWIHSGVHIKYVAQEQPEQPEQHTIYFNANGGYSGPGAIQVTNGESYTVTTVKPVKDRTRSGSYTITFNANGGTLDTDSMSATKYTNYEFNHWNDDPNGSGPYNVYPGTIIENVDLSVDLTLYAIYSETTSVDSIKLPSATRSGYTFLGWSKSSSATNVDLFGGADYTPDGTRTLYAVWSQNTADPEPTATDKVYIKISGSWKLLNL